MSKLVIKVNKTLHDSDRNRIEEQIRNDLIAQGFVVIDNNFEVYEIDEGVLVKNDLR